MLKSLAFAFTFLVLALTLYCFGPAARAFDPDERIVIFKYLVLRYDVPAAVWALAVLLVGLLPIAGGAWIDGLMRWVSRRVGWISVACGVVCAVLAVVVYRAHPLSLDEYSPYFQAQLFARGDWVARYRPDLLQWVFFPPFLRGFFITSLSTGQVASAYWPGFALAMAPFAKLGVPFLLNPILAAASLWFIHRIASDVLADDAAAGWAVVFAIASPAFVVNGISFYSMNAHMFANLVFAALVLRPSPWRLFAAGVIGAWALSLHNPVPHAVFAAPLLLWIASRPDRVRNLAALAAGYIPLGLVLVGGWTFLKTSMPTIGINAAGGTPIERLGRLADSGFELPSPRTLVYRAIGLSKLTTWAVPGLVGLALAGVWRGRRDVRLFLLGAAALTTFIAFFAVPFSQGHGWGNRYFHSAWGTLPILAAAGLASITKSDASAARRATQTVFVWTALSLTVLNAQRLLDVSEFMSRHLAQRPVLPKLEGAQYLCFIRSHYGHYAQDLIQNPPGLDAAVIYLTSHGPERDRRFAETIDPEARFVGQSPVAWVYRLPRHSLARFGAK